MKKLFISIIVILTMALIACDTPKLEVKDRIKAPENRLPPISGKWKVEKSIESPHKMSENKLRDEYEDEEFLFFEDIVMVLDEYIPEPSYKIRIVNLSDFLLYNFKVDLQYLGIKEREAEVITLLGNNQEFYEFIRYDTDKMIIFTEENFLFLQKESEEVSGEEIYKYINKEKNIKGISTIEESEDLSSGLLLGVKSYEYDELKDLEDWSYKTIWVKSDNRHISSLYKLDDLLVPRKKGFYLIDVVRDYDNGSFMDNIKSTPRPVINRDYKLAKYGEFLDRVDRRSILKHILYVGNDYISTEIVDNFTNKRRLEVYNIDSLEKKLPILFSDIVAGKDENLFKEGAQNILNTDESLLLSEENFGLYRRNGYWIFKGRVNYSRDGEELYKEYNIKTIPPKEIVNYDELAIPWSIINAKIPDAVDAFISPNEDIIIIETRNDMLIYSIQDRVISEKEIGRIKKSYSDSIVMAEWAVGRYTKLWEEEVLRNSPEQLDVDRDKD